MASPNNFTFKDGLVMFHGWLESVTTYEYVNMPAKFDDGEDFYSKVFMVKQIIIHFHRIKTAEVETSDPTVLALEAFGRLPVGVIEFRRIVAFLPIRDRRILLEIVDEEYSQKKAEGLDLLPIWFEFPAEKAKAPEADGLFKVIEVGTQVAVTAVGKFLADEVLLSSFRSSADKCPIEKAAAGLGLTMVIGGLILQHKKAGLSKFMVKSGAAVLAFAILLPTVMALPPVPAAVFGALSALTVLLTAALF